MIFDALLTKNARKTTLYNLTTLLYNKTKNISINCLPNCLFYDKIIAKIQSAIPNGENYGL